MSALHDTENVPNYHSHDWEKSEHKIDGDIEYYYNVCKICKEVRYPAYELHKLQQYAKENLFLFVEDWVLVLLSVGHDYLSGITHFQKELFLIFKEFAPKHNIPSENPGFYGYKYGPYSVRIDLAIGFLIEHSYIQTEGRKSSNNEMFFLTKKGRQKIRNILSKFSKSQIDALEKFRKLWDQKTAKALCRYIYSKEKYSEYIQESKILKELFPDRKLYRRRG